jgi:hypothetical protein
MNDNDRKRDFIAQRLALRDSAKDWDRAAEGDRMMDSLERFNEEFADVANNPALLSLVMKEDAKLLKEGDERDYLARWSSIVAEVTGRDDGYANLGEQLSFSGTDDEAARIVGFLRRGSFAPQEDEVDTGHENSDVIALMAQARATPQIVRAMFSKSLADAGINEE